MISNNQLNIEVIKAKIDDNFEMMAELLYKTDQYIYPYWFGSLENCKKELPSLLKEENFFFHYSNLYVAIDKDKNKIIGLICAVDKHVNLEYDYTKLKEKNSNYKFTIEHYINSLINEVKESDFAYISNVCVHEDYRGKHIGNILVRHVIDIYTEKCFKEIVLDVLAQNPGAIRLYQNLGFEQFTEIFKGFNHPDKEKPDVFSMKVQIDQND